MKDFYFPNMPNTLTNFFLAVAEEVLVQGLVPVLVVELGGHLGGLGDGQEVGHADALTHRAPVELLYSHYRPWLLLLIVNYTKSVMSNEPFVRTFYPRNKLQQQYKSHKRENF